MIVTAVTCVNFESCTFVYSFKFYYYYYYYYYYYHYYYNVNPLTALPAKNGRTRLYCFKTLQLFQSRENCLNCQLEHWVECPSNWDIPNRRKKLSASFLQNITF